MIEINKYAGNKKVLVKLINELQAYLVKIDPLRRLQKTPAFGTNYTNNLLEKVRKNKGIIYIAEIENIAIGIVAGIIEKPSKEEEIEAIPSKTARVLELIVSEKYRGKNIGQLLMQTIEKYFQQQGCDIIRIEVLEANQKAHNFYQKAGYQDRVIDMIKEIS
ncbi:MAG: GNAT family N-acetyltransferase [Candidatus Gracilibacteria bacterium]|nr:GNAT family N-acetyltransferase [Candidatus Gracilibacteria bacterium]